jgi:hypothetical protein
LPNIANLGSVQSTFSSNGLNALAGLLNTVSTDIRQFATSTPLNSSNLQAFINANSGSIPLVQGGLTLLSSDITTPINIQFQYNSSAPPQQAPPTLAIDQGHTVHVGQLSVQIPGTISVGDSAVLSIDQGLRVPSNSSLNIVLGAQNSATLNLPANLSINGPLNIQGKGLIEFPTNANQVNANPNGVITIGAGAQAQGQVSNATLYLQTPPDSTSESLTIPANQVLTSTGLILGGDQSRIGVSSGGVLNVGGSAVQPGLDIQAGGQVKIQPGFQTFLGGNISLIGSGSQLLINNTGLQTHFKQFGACATGSVITYYLTTPFSQATSGTILTYAGSTNHRFFTCSIQVIDSTGATIQVTNPNSGTSSRRLLSTSTTTASWGDTTLNYATSSAIKFTISFATIFVTIFVSGLLAF